MVKRGRPTKYKEEYPEKLLQHMSEGFSYESFAAIAGVCVDTLYEWAKKHPLFAEAKRRGWAASLRFYEDVGLKGLRGEYPKFSQTTWIFIMKCRFRAAGYMDQVVHEHKHDFEYDPEKKLNDKELFDAIRKLKE